VQQCVCFDAVAFEWFTAASSKQIATSKAAIDPQSEYDADHSQHHEFQDSTGLPIQLDLSG
jgi:hypothetical protein